MRIQFTEDLLVRTDEKDMPQLDKIYRIFKKIHTSDNRLDYNGMDNRKKTNLFTLVMNMWHTMNIRKPEENEICFNFKRSDIDYQSFAEEIKQTYRNNFGLIITKVSNTNTIEYNPIPNSRHMPAAEQAIKEGTKELHIEEKDNIIYCWTKKTLSIKQIAQLRSLELEINKDRFESISESYKAFLLAIAEENIQKAQDIINEFLNSDEFKIKKFEKLKPLLGTNHGRKLKTLERHLRQLETQRRNTEHELMRIITDLRDTNETYNIMRTKKVEDKFKLIARYLSKHPYIINIEPDSGYVNIEYNAPVFYFDEDLTRQLMQKTESPEQALIYNTLLEGKYQLWTYCAIQFDPVRFVIGRGKHDYGNDEFLPHPHIEQYGCFGNHMTPLREAAEAEDYLNALEQISQAVLNLNVTDGIVMNTMLDNLMNYYRYYKTFKNVETEEWVSFADIIEREAKNGEAETE